MSFNIPKERNKEHKDLHNSKSKNNKTKGVSAFQKQDKTAHKDLQHSKTENKEMCTHQ